MTTRVSRFTVSFPVRIVDLLFGSVQSSLSEFSITVPLGASERAIPWGTGEDDRPIHLNSDQSPAVPRRGLSPLTSLCLSEPPTTPAAAAITKERATSRR